MSNPTREEVLFHETLARPAAERGAFLQQACAGDTALRARVEVLLAAYDRAPSFLDEMPVTRQTPPIEERPGQLIGRYKLLQQIGEGGCGVVYMAEQQEPVVRRVALKVIKLGMDTKEVIARFEAERQALAMMDHPNIAKVLDAGATETGRPYFVMELVRGMPITKFCDEQNLSTAARLELFTQVCHAIQHAHQKGIIHRDIKPSNILVTPHDDTAVPKVIDFGIAKATQGRLTDATVFTAFEQFIGTPAYMSPEQAEFNALDVDTRSDVYSLGVLLYELLTGRPPFDPKTLVAGGLDQIRRIIREVDPPRPSTRLNTLAEAERTTLARLRGIAPAQLSSLLRGDLDWIVMKALEKNRSRRYESASAFAIDVQRYLGHEPVVARPPSQVYLMQKLIRRHRLAFAAGGAIAAALVLGLGFSTWSFLKEKAARQRAVAAEQEQSRQRAQADTARRRAVAAEAEQSKAREQAELARERAVVAEGEQSRLRVIESELRARAEAQALAARRQSYASDMNLVQQALAIDNLDRARELLNRQRPKPGELDLRGWEWRYLWQFGRSESASVLSDKPANTGTLSVSSDGAWLATAEFLPAAVKLWNLRTRQEISLAVPPESPWVTVAFALDGPLLAIGWVVGSNQTTATGKLRIWSVATKKTVSEWDVDHPPLGLYFAADGQTLLSRGARGGMATWRIPTGELVKREPTMPPRGAALAVTRDLSLAAFETGSSVIDGTRVFSALRVVNLATGVDRWTLKPGREDIKALAFSPDGKIVASAAGSVDPAVSLWNVETGKELGTLSGHRSYVRAIEFWADGKTVATGSIDQTIRIWDVAAQRLVRVLHGHTRPVHRLALLPDQTTLVSAAGDGTLRLWDTTAPRRPAQVEIETMLRRTGESWRFAADSQSVIAMDLEGNVLRFRAPEFREREQVAAFGRVGFACLADDLPLVAFARPNGVVQIKNWETGAMVRELNTPAAVASPIAFIERGKKLLLDYRSGNAAVRGLFEWDVTTGEKIRGWPRATLLGDYVLSPDGRRCLVRPSDKPPGFPNDGNVAPPNDGPCSLIDLDSGVERKLDLTTAGNGFAAFSPDGRFFVAPVGISTAVWETKTFQPVTTITGSIHGMQGALFSADGKRLIVTSSAVEAIRVWEVAGWEQVLTLSAPGSMFVWSRFSPDGNVLAAMNYYGRLHLWRAPSWAEIEAAEKGKGTL